MQVTVVCQWGWRTWKLEGNLETRPVLTHCSELSAGRWPGVSPAQPALTPTERAAEKSVGGSSPEICQLCPLHHLKLRTPLLNNSTECLPCQHTLETPVLILHWKQPKCPATWGRVKEEGQKKWQDWCYLTPRLKRLTVYKRALIKTVWCSL